MAKRKQTTRPRRSTKRTQRTQCHVVSNTHWDREWKHSAQRTRHSLVHMLDMLLDILRREPEYRQFHLDSQTVPLLDYLEVRPEREDEIRAHVQSGRLAVGPWFCLPDEFCVGGESLVRNLLLGHRIARDFGAVSKTGYSPFSWGQISQMPQIYQGFGIDVMMFYRGVNTHIAPRSEFVWKAPDGTEIIASRLAARPRYNVWYVLQRPAYWGASLDALNDFRRHWGDAGAAFRMVDGGHAHLEYLLAHPPFEYDASVIPAAAEQALAEQDDDWSTPHRFWSIGHDSSCPDVRELSMIADAQAALDGRADVFHSTLAAFQDGIRANRRDDWPTVTGEMRHTYTKGSTSSLLGWILSARMYLKQDNFHTERELMTLAEPLAVCASLLGAEYPRALLDRAMRWLLENHCHDSIGGCGRDVVHDDMLYRFRQAREIATCVLEQAVMDIAGAIDLRDWPRDEVALVVYNPLPRTRTGVLRVLLDTPADWQTDRFEIIDERGRTVPMQSVAAEPGYEEMADNPNDVQTFLKSTRHDLRLAVKDMPAVGYRTLRVRPVSSSKPQQPRTLRTGPQTMENEHLRVAINANGTLDVHDKRRRKTYAGLAYFRDSGAGGNPWQHIPPKHDAEFTTLNERARVALIRDGELECTFRVRLDWQLPQSLSADGACRSDVFDTLPIETEVTLRRGQPWVELVTVVDNSIKDHYLRVSFPTGLRSDTVHVQTPFDVVGRDIRTPDYSRFDDDPQPEQPMHSFVDIADGERGLAVFNEGLKAYEAHDDPARTLSITLLRAFALRFFVPEKADHEHLARGSQCPGKHTFRYAICPHAGDWQAGGVWPAAEAFTTPLLAAQIAASDCGHLPLARSFLEMEPAELHVSAIKQSESGDAWIVRLFNPMGRAVRGRVRLNGGRCGPGCDASPVERLQQRKCLPAKSGRKWRKVRQVTLDEVPVRDLKPETSGWVRVDMPAKRIVTLEFLP